MPTPTSDTYTAASGATLQGGRGAPVLPPSASPTALRALLAAAPEDSWVKANLNELQQVWPGSDYQPLDNGSPSIQRPVISAWSSFAWDDDAQRAIIWGGGHANTATMDVYMWDGANRNWITAFYSPDLTYFPSGSRMPIGGPLTAPKSSHTYANNNWLPVQQRFITFGGAEQTSGDTFSIVSAVDGSLLRWGGAWTLDMTQAGQGKVSTGTGTNVKRGTTTGVTLQGANAWNCRDYFLDHPNQAQVGSMRSRINGFNVYALEGGRDVLYQACSGSTSLGLTRIEFVDGDYRNDLLSRAGNASGNNSTNQGGAIDTANRIIVACGGPTQPFEAWSLAAAGPNNYPTNVQAAAVGGAGKASYFAAQTAAQANGRGFGMGMLYDERRGRYVMWGSGAPLWYAPGVTAAQIATGWTIESVAVNGTGPKAWGHADLIESGIHGKWKRSAKLDCYIGLQDALRGDMWLYKPAGWTPLI